MARCSGIARRRCEVFSKWRTLAEDSVYQRKFTPRLRSSVVKRSGPPEVLKMKKYTRVVQLMLALQMAAIGGAAARPDNPQSATITEKTTNTQKLIGYFNLYWDAKQGKLWLEIDKWNSEFLYQSGLSAGIGSNDIGLDRGQLSATRIVRFERSGSKVLLVQENWDYRAISDDQAERPAGHDSFAESRLRGFRVSAGGKEPVLVGATVFFLRDVHAIPATLRKTKQGTYHLDPARSAIYLPLTKNFPLNAEVESILTFAGDEPGAWLKQVTPSPESITVREHHSFVQLPPAGYQTRVYDPRASFFGISYMDYATPVSEPIVKRFITRHRLVKKDPAAATSEPVQPIIYYLDRGAPEPLRSALLEGARWWNQAFEAAGYKDAFRVELMPEDADPMDLRYNVIQWVHRATRGWSYGANVIDPRTGEIIKGHVTLGSLRARPDALIGNGLAPPIVGVQGCDMAMPPGPEYLAALDPSADLGTM